MKGSLSTLGHYGGISNYETCAAATCCLSLLIFFFYLLFFIQQSRDNNRYCSCTCFVVRDPTIIDKDGSGPTLLPNYVYKLDTKS